MPSHTQRPREKTHVPSHSIESMNSDDGWPTPGLAAPAWMLRRVLAVCDITTVAVGWLTVLVVAWLGDHGTDHLRHLVMWLTVATGVTAAVLSREQLYLARVLAIRAVEVQRVGRTCLIAAVVLVAVDHLVGSPLGPLVIGVGSLTTYALLLVSRGAFQAWLHDRHRHGGRGRSLLIVDNVDDARRTLALLADRPELGYDVVGYVSARRLDDDMGVPWLGTPADLALLTRLTAVKGVLVVAGAVEPAALLEVVPELRLLDVHVHVAVDDGEHEPNIRVLPLVHRFLPPSGDPALSTVQQIVKRAFDVVAGGMLAILVAPALLAAAVAIKLTAGGPVFVRDTRFGPNGEQLVVTRLRTRDLPPRRAARLVGRLCRRLCIDELPQLGNVLAGSMSLVGPRPRRPSRAGIYLAVPTGMHAGLIGLRHVEPFDYPEHEAYRRLDHFYAENWSLSLDMSIVAASATHVLWRTARDAVRGDEGAVVG